MKKVIICLGLWFAAFQTQAQIIGGNGEGFSYNFLNSDLEQLKLLATVQPFAIRWPGGGDAKVAFPNINTPGLGMNADSIKNLYDAFRDGQGLIKVEAMEKDLKKVPVDNNASESELMSIIRTAHAIPGFQVSYSLNVLQGNVETNLTAITTLIDSGVNIIAVVAGNETFASYNYDWERYKNDFEPILKAIQQKYPDIPRLLCVGQAIHRKTHIQWNAKLFDYIKSTGDFISGVDVHYYLFDELKDANAAHPGAVDIKRGEANAKLDAAFALYMHDYRTKDELTVLAAYLKANLPGKIYHCTEFGDKDAENWSNTLANGAHIFSTFCNNRNNFDILLMHNLLGNWFWGARRPIQKWDGLNMEDGKANRVPWFALQLANELPTDAKPLTKDIQLKEPGVYYFYFDCVGDAAEKFNSKIFDGKNVTCEIHYVTGNFPYSSSGATGFWTKTSEKFYEIDGIDIATQKGFLEIPANAFGYVRINVPMY